MCEYLNIASSFLLDSLAAFCITVNPHVQGQIWWSNWNAVIQVTNIENTTNRKVITVDSNAKGGRITNIVFHPAEAAIIFVAGLNMQGIYRSINGGRTWKVILQKKNRLLWYSGESLIIREVYGQHVLIASDITTGSVEWSYDNGDTWRSYETKVTSSICAIELMNKAPLEILASSRSGMIMKINLEEQRSRIVWKANDEIYVEIPRINRSIANSSDVFCITAGFDSTKTVSGLMISNDGGQKWSSGFLPGISIWAMEQCGCGHHIILGGFSEFSFVKGAGFLAVLCLDNLATLNINSILKSGRIVSSIWDISNIHDSKGNIVAVALSGEGGVYLLK
ncbi:MAG: hypothetical protein HYX66_04220 [Ignavibacteria bacterium]|nr:hypothetical protein [Ignavibacteria bacterium]